MLLLDENFIPSRKILLIFPPFEPRNKISTNMLISVEKIISKGLRLKRKIAIVEKRSC